VIIKADDRSETKWELRLFEMTLVLIRYSHGIVPVGKKKLIVQKYWDKYFERQSNCSEPALTAEVRELARRKLIDLIEVKTWSEWKSK